MFSYFYPTFRHVCFVSLYAMRVFIPVSLNLDICLFLVLDRAELAEPQLTSVKYVYQVSTGMRNFVSGDLWQPLFSTYHCASAALRYSFLVICFFELCGLLVLLLFLGT